MASNSGGQGGKTGIYIDLNKNPCITCLARCIKSRYNSGITNRFKENSPEELNFISDEYLYPYLSYIKENRKVFRTVLSHSEAFGFNDIFQRLYENIFNPILEKFNYPLADRKYVMIFYLNGITAIVTEWLKDECEKTIGEVSRIIYECIFGLKNDTV